MESDLLKILTFEIAQKLNSAQEDSGLQQLIRKTSTFTIHILLKELGLKKNFPLQM